MISASDLSEEQKAAMTKWAEEGADLPDIQKRLKGQFGLNITYMDARLLVLDLGIEIKVEEAEETPSSDELQEEAKQGNEISPESVEEVFTDSLQGGGLV